MNLELTTPIEVCGVTITPNIVSLLTRWQDHLPTDISSPETYVNYLTDIQDHLTVVLADYGTDKDQNRIVDLLTKLILIKEELKLFVVQ